MIQSKLASVNVTPKTTRNAAESRRLARVHRGSRSSSCRTERRRIARAKPIHAAQYTSERARKNGRASQTRLKASAESVAENDTTDHGYSCGRMSSKAIRSAAAYGIVDRLRPGD